MGNNFSGIPSKIEEIDPARILPEQRDYLAKLKERCKHQTVHKLTMILNQKVPGYFESPKYYPQIKLGRYEKPKPGTYLPYRPPVSAPPAPSFIHFHPSSDILRRFLFLHVYSDKFAKANVKTEKLYVVDENGEGEGKLKIAYVFVVSGVQFKNAKDSRLVKNGELIDEEKEELLEVIPTLSKFRVLVSTSQTTALSEHPDIKSHTRTLTTHVEITPFDRQNHVIRPPGVVAVEVTVEIKYEREMRFLEEKKDWEWVVEMLREVLRAMIGTDGGIWDFMGGKYEGVGTEIEGEGVVKCYIVREGGV